MTIDSKLERYLSKLEEVLRPFPVSDRAEIVTEIKSHILSALERDTDSTVDSVLAALGEPETVANRYLIERGLKPTKPPISPIVKWLVLGFLGTFGLFLIFAIILITRFSPVLKIDEDKDQVSVLGGLIQIDGTEGKVIVGGKERSAWFGPEFSFSGSSEVVSGARIEIDFGNGKIDFQNSKDTKLHWDCKTRGDSDRKEPRPEVRGDKLNLSLSGFPGVKCDIHVPEKSRLVISGSNGKIDFHKPGFHVETNLSNGKVDFNPDPKRAYRYDVAVTNGKVDSFESSGTTAKGDGLEIKIRLANGKISKGE